MKGFTKYFIKKLKLSNIKFILYFSRITQNGTCIFQILQISSYIYFSNFVD